ncbi:hypothetical protein FHX44_118226 [Pseudonocardia hierapolitana]|uniref:Uncharacterized protein n=1 Tax=Pseudonocardia hierapolitana TaxID=1128676 RepID=A0A561T583_9PSEU|nr:hypothetical protein FHX44_118226 [Pseudonocardia hierapolitana]
MSARGRGSSARPDAAAEVIERAMSYLDERTARAEIQAETDDVDAVSERRDLLDDLATVLANVRVPAADVPARLRDLAPNDESYRRLTGVKLREVLERDHGIKVPSTGNRYPVDPLAIRSRVANGPQPVGPTMSSPRDARVRSVRCQRGRRDSPDLGAAEAWTGHLTQPNFPNYPQVDAVDGGPVGEVRNLTRSPRPNSGADRTRNRSAEDRAEPTVAPPEGREHGRGKRSGVPRASRADTARRVKGTRQLVGLSAARPTPTSPRGRCAATSPKAGSPATGSVPAW